MKTQTKAVTGAGNLPREWPNNTRFIDSEGKFVLFRDRDNRIISMLKIGDSDQAIGVANRLRNDLKEYKLSLRGIANEA